MYPDISLRTICDVFGRTRQAHYKQIQKHNELAMQQAIIVKLVEEVRAEMPGIGGKKLFFLLKTPMLEHSIDIGRDKFFDILSAFGFLIRKRKRRKPITTDSNHPFYKYPNLVKELQIFSPNHVWVSDITYIALSGRFAYLSLITDAYSRKIVGHCLWLNLSAQGTLNALRMALESYTKRGIQQLIHHSDRGLQYCCKEYTNMLANKGISISMTENGDPYENAIAERVNGILKTEFSLNTYKTYDAAKEAIDKAVEAYNSKRPHLSWDYMTPNQAHQTAGKLTKKWKKTIINETV